MTRLMFVGEDGFVGGAQISMWGLLRELSSRSVDCIAVVPSPNRYSEMLRGSGIDVTRNRLDELKRDYIRISPVIREVKNLGVIMDEFLPDVIHADAPWAAFFTLLAARRRGIPVLCSLHWYPEAHKALKRAVFRTLRRYVISNCRKFAVFSEHMLSTIVNDYGFPIHKVSMISYGIEKRRLENSMSRDEWQCSWGIPSGAILYTCVARLHPQKGILDVLDAARIVSRKVDKAFFAFAGEEVVTPMENLHFTEEIHARAASLGIDGRIRLLGFQDDIGTVYGASDVLVHASFREPFGLGVAEASISGLPVVAYGVGGIPETVIDGENGFLVPPMRPDLLAGKLIRLGQDAELRRRLGRRGKELGAKQHSMAEMTAQLISLYEEVAQ